MHDTTDIPSVFIHPTACVDKGAQLLAGCRVWHFTHIMPRAKLGHNCNIGQNVFIANGVQLGNNVKVQNNVSLYEGLICEDDVFIGPSVVFTNVKNPRSAVNRKGEYIPTYVHHGATLGANSTIVCGVTIGAYAMVGAGAVVTKSVLPYALVVGTPARFLYWISQQGYQLHFNERGIAHCSQEGIDYQLQGQVVTPLLHPEA